MRKTLTGHKTAGVFLAAALLTAGMTVATVGTASATTDPPTAGACDHVPVSEKSAGATSGDPYYTFNVQVNLKDEPASQCTNVGVAYSGGAFYVWCSTTNIYGNKWYFGESSNDGNTYGWTYSGNVTHHSGTVKAC